MITSFMVSFFMLLKFSFSSLEHRSLAFHVFSWKPNKIAASCGNKRESAPRARTCRRCEPNAKRIHTIPTPRVFIGKSRPLIGWRWTPGVYLFLSYEKGINRLRGGSQRQQCVQSSSIGVSSLNDFGRILEKLGHVLEVTLMEKYWFWYDSHSSFIVRNESINGR